MVFVSAHSQIKAGYIGTDRGLGHSWFRGIRPRLLLLALFTCRMPTSSWFSNPQFEQKRKNLERKKKESVSDPSNTDKSASLCVATLWPWAHDLLNYPTAMPNVRWSRDRPSVSCCNVFDITYNTVGEAVWVETRGFVYLVRKWCLQTSKRNYWATAYAIKLVQPTPLQH